MFTGLIEELGRVKVIKKESQGWKLKIEARNVLEDLKVGDSIAIDGVCLTVTNVYSQAFQADLSSETLKVTYFLNLHPGQLVNLERALKVGDRLGGHFLLGHIDGVGKVKALKKEKDFTSLTIDCPREISQYLVYKGSVGINGVSLTVAELDDHFFTVALIPLTLEKTNLSLLKSGDLVNIETDIFGKYVKKFLKEQALLKDSTDDSEKKRKKFQDFLTGL